jgi:NTE family protein
MVKNVALVLGGGGSAGHAWTIGVIAGLAEAGIDMTEVADLVIGTSSGATAAAQVRSGIPPGKLLASLLSEPVPLVGQKNLSPYRSQFQQRANLSGRFAPAGIGGSRNRPP